jgi:hypothetical protein
VSSAGEGKVAEMLREALLVARDDIGAKGDERLEDRDRIGGDMDDGEREANREDGRRTSAHTLDHFTSLHGTVTVCSCVFGPSPVV